MTQRRAVLAAMLLVSILAPNFAGPPGKEPASPEARLRALKITLPPVEAVAR